MSTRVRLDDEVVTTDNGGNYFASQRSTLEFINSGCSLLDCVLGGGWPLSRVVNVVGDECLAADTVVSVKRGVRPRKMTMETLFRRARGNHPNRNAENDTYLVADVGGWAGSAKMVDIVSSGDKVLYEITNDRGQVIKASENHKFSTLEGWQCLIDGLTVGTVAKVWQDRRGRIYYNAGRSARVKREVVAGINFHPFAWNHFIAGYNYKRLPVGRLLIEADINGLLFEDFVYILRREPEIAATLQYTSPSFEVHHLDGDPTNDSLDNLQLVSPKEHWAIHAGGMPVNTKPIESSEITSIRRVGAGQTFDITMEAPHHNFIANGFVVHNSTGKTLIAIEAMANFNRQFPKGRMFYREAEASFEEPYAAELGMPVDKVSFIDPDEGKFETIEDFYQDLEKCLDTCLRIDQPGFYVLDSLDALTSQDEIDDSFGKGSYGGAKPKQLGKLFRLLVSKVGEARMCLMIISQTRDKIGITFGGPQKTRSGGRSLDFYASQVLWLSQRDKSTETKSGVKRVTGVHVRAQMKKSKIALPYRECDFTIRFGHGIDSLASSLDWLEGVKKLDGVIDSIRRVYENRVDKMNDSDYWAEVERVDGEVIRLWREIEGDFLDHNRPKYRSE